MSAPCRVCGRPLDDCGTCVCATFLGPRPAPVPWSWVTEDEAADLRAALHTLRCRGIEPEAVPQVLGGLRQYVADGHRLADLVEQLLAEMRHRRPRAAEEHEDIALHLGGARAPRGPVVELACVCKEPGCGTSFAWHPGLHESRSYCYFHSQPKRKEPSA